jgi:hypothetical protein
MGYLPRGILELQAIHHLVDYSNSKLSTTQSTREISTSRITRTPSNPPPRGLLELQAIHHDDYSRPPPSNPPPRGLLVGEVDELEETHHHVQVSYSVRKSNNTAPTIEKPKTR